MTESGTGPRRPTARLDSPTSAADLVRNLARVTSRPGKAARTAQIVAALRSRVAIVLLRVEAEEIVDRLSSLDPTWASQLAVAAKQLPKRDTPAARLLREVLIDGAKQHAGFPRDQGDPAEVAGWVLSWVARVARSGPDRRPAAMITMALLDQRREIYYADALMACLETRAGVDRRLFDVSRYERSVVELMTSPTSVAARRAMDVVCHVERSRAIADADRKSMTEQRDHARVRLAHVEQQGAAVSLSLSERTLEVQRLEQELTLARDQTVNTAREGEMSARNSVGRVRTSVLSVLELETEQIRAYLDRPTPNVPGALASLQHIEQLRDELKRE